jgi:hypothetical protein
MPKFESTLRFSRYFTGLQLILCMGSLLSLTQVFMPVSLKISLILSVLLYFLWNCYSHRQWQSIGHDDNGWYLEKNSKRIPVIPAGDSTLTSFVSILRFREDNKWFTQSCLIFRDSLSADNYRRFLVRISLSSPRKRGSIQNRFPSSRE